MPKPYGIEHLIFLGLFFTIAALGTFLYRRFIRTRKAKDIVVKVVAGILLVSVLLNRLSISIVAKNALQFIPDTYCGVTSLLLSVCALVFRDKNSNVFHFFVYVAFVGALINNLYPDYIGQGSTVFHSRTITGLLHHTFSIYLVMVLFLGGDFRPELKKWWCLPLGLCVFITYGIFAIQILGRSNSMYINKPLLPNSPFTWWFTGLLLMILQLTFLVIYELITKRKSTQAK